ncbi:glycosyltransferase family 4 protein [Candidatus Poribacteria bacterium]|nr:glycosyltransferase family 4 protein [Candidatus Poribacteria bacterium]
MTSQLKVTFAASDKPRNVGGPIVFLQRLLPALKSSGADVRALLLSFRPGRGDLELTLRANGIPCHALRVPQTVGGLADWFLRRLREDPPHVFVTNYLVAAHYAARPIREAGIPAISILHSDDPFHHGLIECFTGRDEPWSVSAVVAVSQALEQLVHERPHESVLCRRIPYPVPVPKTRASWRGHPFRMIYTGRYIQEQKRIREVTQALVNTARQVEGVEGVLHGGGVEGAIVEEVLRSAGPDCHVRDGGRLNPEGVIEALLDAQALMLLSDYEGLPISLMEAMACGVVPICSQIQSGIPELVHHEETGLIVSDREAGPVEAVRRMTQDRALWERLSANARALIEREYSPASVAKAWMALFQELLDSAGPRKPIPRKVKWELPEPHPGLMREEVRSVFSVPFLRSWFFSRIRDY